jgi:hypothetical protein
MKCVAFRALSEKRTPWLAMIPNGISMDARETADYSSPVERLELLKPASIDNARNDFANVVHAPGIAGHDPVDFIRSVLRLLNLRALFPGLG